MLFVVSRSKRRIALVIVSSAVTVAACLGIDPHLSTTQQLAVVVNPGSMDFGMVNVGVTAPGPSDIVISPAGTGDSIDTVMSISDSCGLASPFKVMGPIPATVSRMCMGSGTGTTFAEPNGTGGTGTCTTVTATYMATFTPNAPGTQQCTITFFGTFGMQQVVLSGTGVAPPTPQIDVSPPSISFGDIRVNATSPPTNLTITNTGGATLAIASIMHGNSVFNVGGQVGPHNLGPGLSESHPVTCTPTAVQTFNDTIVIASNAANQAAVNVMLSCNGTDAAVSMSGQPPDLQTRVGEPLDQVITIQNEGGATSMLTTIDVVPAVSNLTRAGGATAPVTLGPNQSVTVTVHYDAAVPQDFGELGRLKVVADGKNVEFVINGGAQITSLGLNPDTVDFGPICGGQNASMPVAVFASAQGNVQINSLTKPGAPFDFTGNLPATAQGNHGNDVMFTASVAPTAAGELDDTAVLVTDMPGAAMREITLHADALAPGTSATPRMLDFGSIAENLVTPAQSVKLTNCDAAAIQITGAHIEGASPGEFAIVSQDIAGQLMPTQSKEMLLVMTPHTAGAKLAVLVIEHGENTFVDLVGNGLGGDGNDDEDRVTYYNCSAGGPVGLAPLALVLGALVLRRRRR